MKRTSLKSGGSLTRRTPLTSAASLPRSPFPRSTRPVQPPVARPAIPRAPKRATRRTAPSGDVVAAVRDRDGWRCIACGKTAGEWCTEAGGNGVVLDGLVTHHRAGRQMGGSTAAWVNLPANTVTVHSSLNSAMEADPAVMRRAYAAGWKVRRPASPDTVPVQAWDGWWLLDNEGGRTMTGAPT